MPKQHETLNKSGPGDFQRRFSAILWIISCTFLVLGGRLWYLQILKGSELRQRSECNRIRTQEIKPMRGLVMDARRTILVDNHPSFDIAIIPEEATAAVAMDLGALLGESPENVSSQLLRMKGRKPFMPVTMYRDVSMEKLAIAETNSIALPGVVTSIVPIRQYILGPVMAHVVGYVGEISGSELRKREDKGCRAGDITGKYGIENSFDDYLRGRHGGEQIEVNVRGRKLKVLGKAQALPGSNIVLTIDGELQKVCWDSFQERAGAVIAMDPRNGAVRALISKPSFDPNFFNRGISKLQWDKLLTDPLSPLQNKAIAGQYPPGSAFKIVVAAAALEMGIITPHTKIDCSGSYTVGDRTFRCWKKEGHGSLDVYRAIGESCDVFFYIIGEQIGVDRLADYTRAFGFGFPTKIDLPGEKKGLVPTKKWKKKTLNQNWHRGETISLSIGQGFMLVTPLQLLSAYAAVANGGVIYRPRLLESIENADGSVLENCSTESLGTLPLKKSTIDILRRSLWGAVNEDWGTGKVLRRPDQTVCGKTGTAQVIGLPEEEGDRELNIPYRLRDHAIFVCFAPYQDPEIALMVIVEHGGHGGSSAAPIARKIIDWYLDRGKKQPLYCALNDR
ncbi:MAG: penicillin-binding protein 2 [Deltaproteobacteria bacterium]|nr:penicillin-binding protein 2 [Deltaproteobacteria bacterium]